MNPKQQMKKTLIVFLWIFLIINAEKSSAQHKYTLSGYIKDETTGEALIGANIVVEELKAGSVSNIYGYYSITLPEGNYTIVGSYIGYAPVRQTTALNSDQKFDFSLNPENNQIDEITVSGEKKDKNVTTNQMSNVKLPIARIQKIPALMGEVDIIKTIQLLPGIKSAGEGSSGFHVRGGGVDQNLILLDDATVYNSSHLFGFFSVFNQDALKDVQIFKGGIPAQYGGRLSSLLDIRMKEGNSKHFAAVGGIGILSSRLTLESPIIKDKMSFIASGRRTYFDLFFPLMKNETVKNAKVYFYDLNAKINYTIDDKNRIFVSGYFGNDIMKFSKDFMTSYGNKTLTVRYNHLFSAKLFSNFTAIYSDFNYGLGVPEGSQSFMWTSNIVDYSLKNDYTLYFGTNNLLNFGASAIYHTFKPGNIEAGSESFYNDYIMPLNYAGEYAIYADNELNIGNKISVRYGLRFSAFQNIGKSTFYTFDKSNPAEYTIVDTLKYTGGVINTYSGLEPRLNIRFTIDEASSLKANYNRTMQYLQLATNSNAPTPYDFWFPSSKNIKPQKADQVAVGYFRNFLDNAFEASFEIYYKKMYNVIDFRDHASLFLNRFLEGEVRAGNSDSYGAEFMLKKQEGKFTGWISYTYSKTMRTIPEINSGKTYQAPHNRPHDISIVLSYDLTKRLNISANWVYSTGSPRTMPTGRYEYEGMIVPVYSDRNSVRLPDYHRGDISVTYNFKSKTKIGGEKRYQSSINVSIYNVYNRHNAYSINFIQDEENPNVSYAEKTYLFPLFPSITYNFKFL